MEGGGSYCIFYSVVARDPWVLETESWLELEETGNFTSQGEYRVINQKHKYSYTDRN